jgi:hypothetical protein
MQTADSSAPAEISRVAVRLLPFWAERPAMWFAQAEAQFTLAGISSEQIKFCYVISQLDHRHTPEVEDIITYPPEQDPYATLRTKLVRRLPLESNASTSSLHSRRWVTASHLSLSGASPQMCQTTSSVASGPAGYCPTYRPFSPANPRATWTPWPTVQTATQPSLVSIAPLRQCCTSAVD